MKFSLPVGRPDLLIHSTIQHFFALAPDLGLRRSIYRFLLLTAAE
jgi:hypothetical protein